MSLKKKMLIGLTIWWIGAVVTYGHAAKQFAIEDNIECLARQAASRLCWDDHRVEAVGASLIWPMHWSEYLWEQKP